MNQICKRNQPTFLVRKDLMEYFAGLQQVFDVRKVRS